MSLPLFCRSSAESEFALAGIAQLVFCLAGLLAVALFCPDLSAGDVVDHRPRTSRSSVPGLQSLELPGVRLIVIAAVLMTLVRSLLRLPRPAGALERCGRKAAASSVPLWISRKIRWVLAAGLAAHC